MVFDQFFDSFNRDRDGCMAISHLQASAAVYRKPTAGIRGNLTRMPRVLGCRPIGCHPECLLNW
jgi:hypothetical protein